MESRFGYGALVAGLVFSTAVAPLQAQQQAAPHEADTAAIAIQQGTEQAAASHPLLPKRGLFTQRDAIVAGAFVAGAAAMLPIDRHIASRLQDPSLQANERLSDIAHGFEGLASPGAYFIGGALFLGGRTGAMLSDAHAFDEVADLGWHGLKAVAMAEVTGYMLKGIIGRARPYVSNATQPHTFRFGGGFGTSDYRALPSGHTYTAFAVASVVTSETRRWNPNTTLFVAPVMYGGATLVGLSRMYHNRHWASDIVLGAAIGTFMGLKVVQHGHDNPNNLIDRIALGTSIAPDGRGGVALAWSTKTPF